MSTHWHTNTTVFSLMRKRFLPSIHILHMNNRTQNKHKELGWCDKERLSHLFLQLCTRLSWRCVHNRQHSYICICFYCTLHSEVADFLFWSVYSLCVCVCVLALWACLFPEEPEYHITKMKHKWIFAQFLIKSTLHQPLAPELFAVFEFDNRIAPHFQFNNN